MIRRSFSGRRSGRPVPADTAIPPDLVEPQIAEHIETLRQREAYLTGRAALKQSLGWEFTYDQRERDALRWALARLWWSVDNGGNDAR